MHKFLRAIGFSNIRKKDMEIILDEIIEHPEMMKITKDSEGNEFAELSRSFASNIGITVRGNYQDDDSFKMEYYYPYLLGTRISTNEQIEVEKHAEKESYAGVCDELNIGVTLIFYLQNVADYLAEINSRFSAVHYGARLAGLSVEGKILCPILDKTKKAKAGIPNREQRNQLMAQAREGDEDAIESLTLEDMDTYALITKRIAKEDVLSIVKSTFMPFGIESDQYSILGEIMDCRLLQNSYTEENVYAIDIKCNDVEFPICINQKDLIGEPTVGRRFKGNIWLQGSINYRD